MGRKSRLKRERREERKANTLPPCSYQHCANGRPPGTHLIRKMQDDEGAGEFLTSCDDCLEPMLAVVRAQGIDAQVFTVAALAQLSKGAQRRAKGRGVAVAVRQGESFQQVPPTPPAG
jgi:hypothetical protein